MNPLTNINQWLEDMSYNAQYVFLEEGRDKDELERIAKKRGIQLPSHDLAIFKCRYAFTDRVNRNGCLLPREEVSKSLSTLVGKAVDFDHFRKRICGTWIDAELEGDEIIAYGSFFKSNLQEDFNTIKELMQKGNLTVSFEAWGNKKPLEGRNYSLNDICFAGGALLIKETPAFPGAGVLELAKDRVLEFAKVMTKPEEFLHTEKETREDDEKQPEMARRFMSENQDILRLLGEVDCAVCHSKGDHDVCHMDYMTSEAMTKCNICGTMHKVSFTPKAEVIGSKQIREIVTLANVALHEDPSGYIMAYEGSDENLESIFAQEFEYEEARFVKCMKCAAALDIHGNKSSCPKCGSRWEKDKPHFQEIRPEERTDSPYAVVNKLNPDPQLSKLSLEERNKLSDEGFAVVVSTKNKKTGKPRKIRMFPIHDSAHVHNALAKLNQASETLKKLGISQETVKSKILNKARELKMEELMKFYKASTVEELIQAMAKEAGAKDGLGTEAIAAVKAQIEQALVQDTKAQTDLAPSVKAFIMPHVTPLINYVKPAGDANDTSLNENSKPGTPSANDTSLNKADVEKLQTELKEASTKLEAAMAELKKYKEAEEAKVQAEKASKIQTRKDELGEFAKEMKDDELLDEVKYEMAKLRKENAELKAKKDEKPVKPDLTKGSADKTINEEELKTRGKVDELAFGRDGKAVEENLKKK